MVARLYENVACSIEGCDRPAHVRGWCERHYSRFKAHGDPTGGVDRPVRDIEDTRARLARGLAQIHNPVGLATRFLASRRLLGGPDHDDLIDVAVNAVVDAAIAWNPGGGRSMLSWAYLYMEREVARELGRGVRRREQMRYQEAMAQGEATWRNDHGLDELTRVDLRVDLQRWADLARLTPLMRFIVSYAALHAGTYVRDTPLAAAGPTPLHGSGAGTLRLALAHMRKAAVTNAPRDDRWTRATDAGRAGRLAKSNQLLERLQAIEAERDRAVDATRTTAVRDRWVTDAGGSRT